MNGLELRIRMHRTYLWIIGILSFGLAIFINQIGYVMHGSEETLLYKHEINSIILIGVFVVCFYFLNQDQKETIKSHAKNNFKVEKKLIIINVVYTIITGFLLFVALDSYMVLEKNVIKVNGIFSSAEQKYTWNAVAEGETYYYVEYDYEESDNLWEEFEYNLLLADGKAINLAQSIGNAENLVQLTKWIESKGVEIESTVEYQELGSVKDELNLITTDGYEVLRKAFHSDEMMAKEILNLEQSNCTEATDSRNLWYTLVCEKK